MKGLVGGIRRRLAFVILLAALIPASGAIWLARSMVEQAVERFYLPEVGEQLDRALGLHNDLVHETKANLRQEAATIAESAALHDALAKSGTDRLEQVLKAALQQYPALVSLEISRGDTRLAAADRGLGIDPKNEHQLVVEQEINEQDSLQLHAIFAVKRQRFAGRDEMSQFVSAYRALEKRRDSDESSYLKAFASLLVGTMLVALIVGGLVASGAVSKLRNLAAATRRVGTGDLSIRVPESGSDEIADLARSFNRMVSEVEVSRARIDYLQRIATWQEMARRLAHEIKNPLTPIQLAIQELQQRYATGYADAGDREFKKLLDTTVEIVDAEVGTLRRLVNEFSGFARLPSAHLEACDLWDFLRSEESQFGLLKGAGLSGEGATKVAWPTGVTLRFEIPPGEATAALDPQLFHRVLDNLIQNAAQAIEQQQSGVGTIVVRASVSDKVFRIMVDDSGPGIAEDARRTIFDPYVTTRTGGTGLGLAIVKKIVMEHHGMIDATHSSLGGARLCIELPEPTAIASVDQLQQEERTQ